MFKTTEGKYFIQLCRRAMAVAAPGFARVSVAEPNNLLKIAHELDGMMQVASHHVAGCKGTSSSAPPGRQVVAPQMRRRKVQV
jgi:hypothetical protein